MIHAFKRGKIGSGIIMLLTLVIAVLIWVRDRNYPLVVPVIATALTVALGVVVSRLVGNILANSENTHYLGILHMELNPDQFLRHYDHVPQQVKGANTAAVCRSYLADGYAADGQYEKAIELLRIAPPAENLAIRGLYAANLAGCYLALEQTEAAEAALLELNQIIDASRANKADLAKNLTDMQKLHKQHLNCLRGSKVDLEWLEDAYDRAQYNLRRLEVAKVAAMTAIRDGNTQMKHKYLTYLRKNGGLTAYKRWADQQN